jgi:hypothetical protein
MSIVAGVNACVESEWRGTSELLDTIVQAAPKFVAMLWITNESTNRLARTIRELLST